MVATLIEPTADAKQVAMYNRGMHAADKIDLVPGAKYALCLLKLHSAAVPSDYGTLKTAIEAISGVQNISLVVDNQDASGNVQTAATVPDGKKLVAVVEINMRIEEE